MGPGTLMQGCFSLMLRRTRSSFWWEERPQQEHEGTQEEMQEDIGTQGKDEREGDED